MARYRLPTRVAFALVLAAAGANPPLAAQSGNNRAEARPAPRPGEYSQIAAQEAVLIYQRCGRRARLATYQGLVAELGSIERLARSKGLGPTLQRVREQHNRLLAVRIMRAAPNCGRGPTRALAGARQAIADFRAWVEQTPAHRLTQEESDAEATQEILAIDDAYAAAVVNRDEAALRHILDDNFAFDRGDGTATDTNGLIATLRGLNLIHYRMTARTAVLRDGVRIVSGTAQLASASATQSVVVPHSYTAVYEGRNGTWRMTELRLALVSRP